MQDGSFEFVNPQFRQYGGYSEDELLGADSLEFVVPEDRDMVRGNAVRMLKGERSSPYEYRFVRKDGGILWIAETVASIRHKGRRATLGSFMDISERKQAEEKLAAAAQKWRTTFDAIADGIALMDTE